MKPFTIGQAAKQTGLSIETIRFYERLGLIAPSSRLDSGYRQYTSQVVNEILFIKNAKQLGFSLDEIGELLRLHANPNGKAVDVKNKTLVKINEIDKKIAGLKTIKKRLVALADACDSRGSTKECAILEGIAPKKNSCCRLEETNV